MLPGEDRLAPMAGDPRFFLRAGPHSLAAVVDAAGGEAPPRRLMLHRIAPLATATGEDVTFCLNSRKNLAALQATGAAAVIVHPDMRDKVPETAVAIVADDPLAAWANVAALFHPLPPIKAGIHPSAVVAASARIDPGTEVGPLAVIGENVVIGARGRIGAMAVIGDGVVLGREVRIGPHASVSHALVGDRVYIYPGARIGQDGFGFAITPEGFRTVPQVGRVIIGNDVEIGANTTVDRGAMDDTVIGEGTRIDNLAQIGHNVRIGRACVIVAQVGISGSAVLEDQVMMGGQAGLAGHLRIGTGARIGAQAGVIADVPARTEVIGSPAQPVKAFFKEIAAIRRWVRDGGVKIGTQQDIEPRRGLKIMDTPVEQTVNAGSGQQARTVEVVDIHRIMHDIPHRYPFLLLDRVVDVVLNTSAVGIKNVSVNEPFFAGHFPNHPVMPGVLIIESMAQTAAVLVVETLGPDAAGKVVYFMSIEGAKFRRPVVPGDQLRIHVIKERNRGNVWKFQATAKVEGVVVAEATYAAMIMDRVAPV